MVLVENTNVPNYATDINDRGQIVGFASHMGAFRADLWIDKSGTFDHLILNGNLGNDAAAFGTNNRGQVVGWSSTIFDYYGPIHACLWIK
jgi:uncharacterized membrane protein